MLNRVKKLNLGCGNKKWKGFENIDIDPEMKPDRCLDIRYQKLPYNDNQIEEVWMSHTIEHIQKQFWPSIFLEVNRVLKPESGIFVLTYPEFLKCVEFWKENKHGKKEFFEHCIYGRQLSQSDYHVSICHTPDMMRMLREYGFTNIVHSVELEPQYSALKMVKQHKTRTTEDVLRETVFKR